MPNKTCQRSDFRRLSRPVFRAVGVLEPPHLQNPTANQRPKTMARWARFLCSALQTELVFDERPIERDKAVQRLLPARYLTERPSTSFL